MEYQLCLDNLDQLIQFGFQINWTLLQIGYYGYKFIPKLLTEQDISSYAIEQLKLSNNKLVMILLACIGYDLDYMGKTDLNDIIYELIFNGHIVFLNISCDSRKIGCLYLPLNITDNQKETLENFCLQLKDYELLKYTINKENMENFLVLNDDIVDNEKVKKKQKF